MFCLPPRIGSLQNMAHIQQTNSKIMTIEVLYIYIYIYITTTIILQCKYITYVAQLDHNAATSSPPPTPSPDPPMFRTLSTNSRLADEEGRLKTEMDE
jgi:hypothetical protein